MRAGPDHFGQTPPMHWRATRGCVSRRGCRIDDTWEAVGLAKFDPTTRDLHDALDAILDGREVVNPVTAAVGCVFALDGDDE